jgi:parvulin-like peptidyl-prolyl isomerase
VEEAQDPRFSAKRADRRHEAVKRLRDQRPRGVMLAVVGVFVLAIAGIVIAAYVIQFVAPNRQEVARVNDTPFSRADLVKLLRVQQLGAAFFGVEFKASSEIFQQLQVLIENEILVQSAPRLGITVTDREIDGYIQALFIPRLPPGEQLDMAQFERDFNEEYNRYLNSVQLSEKDHRETMKRSLLRARFREFIGERVPYVAPQVHYFQLVVTFGDEIDIMLTKFKDATAGDKSPENLQKAFRDLVREFSRDDAETVRLGGDMGWMPEGVLQPYGDLIFNLEAGVLSDPIPDTEDPRRVVFYLVSERTDAGELALDDRETLKIKALQDWINEEREKHEVLVEFNSDVYNWVFTQLSISATPTPTVQPSGLGAIGL